ncbi:MAG: peptidoglycan DD-metalloendopeptidase family protein [Desulfobacterales bacterium]|nr:peptidoglycan DD-metalloendopeptidase family protein [Desulfobacterales bacterium]
MLPRKTGRYFFPFFLLLLLSFSRPGAEAAPKTKNKTQPPVSVIDQFSLNSSALPAGMKTIRGVVKPGQSLAQILRQWKVPYPVIHTAAVKSTAVFNVRKMIAGNSFHAVIDPAAKKGLQYFIYERNDLDYVVFDLRSPVAVYTGKKEVKTFIRFAEGTIESSLWQTLSHKALVNKLVLQTKTLLGGTVDFGNLRTGDKIKLIYEEKTVGNQPVDVGTILSARLTRHGKNYDIYHYREKNRDRYFDENGNNLTKTFLKAPLKYRYISSGFSLDRPHPILKERRKHPAIDYVAPAGTPVMSVGDGVVLKAIYNNTDGNFVLIRHSGTYSSQYAHLSRFGADIKAGKKVRRGDTIGYVGRTGLATGAHLDFQFWVAGKQVDYTKIKLPAESYVASTDRARLQQHMATLKQLLDMNLDDSTLTAILSEKDLFHSS